jgi:hypothetical protein
VKDYNKVIRNISVVIARIFEKCGSIYGTSSMVCFGGTDEEAYLSIMYQGDYLCNYLNK